MYLNQLIVQPNVKIMKTTKKIFALIIVFSFILLCCDPTDTDVLPKNVYNYQKEFSSTVLFWHQLNYYNTSQNGDVRRSELKTSGFSQVKNLSSFDLEMSHIAFKSEFYDFVKINDGRFTITCGNGNQIFGIYEGYGYLSNDLKEMKLLFRIEGGSGDFTQAKGSLNGTFRPDEINPTVKIMDLEGRIILEKDRPVS